MNALLCLCFALSGAGALGLELLWMRSVGLALSASSDAAQPALADVRRTLGALQSAQERLRGEIQSIEQRLRPGPKAGEHWQ